ncbi:hypothetical protein D3C74_20700 [compost metagenome]
MARSSDDRVHLSLISSDTTKHTTAVDAVVPFTLPCQPHGTDLKVLFRFPSCIMTYRKWPVNTSPAGAPEAFADYEVVGSTISIRNKFYILLRRKAVISISFRHDFILIPVVSDLKFTWNVSRLISVYNYTAFLYNYPLRFFNS